MHMSVCSKPAVQLQAVTRLLLAKLQWYDCPCGQSPVGISTSWMQQVALIAMCCIVTLLWPGSCLHRLSTS